MRILIASTYVPFIRGGGNKIVEDLSRELKRRGMQTDTVMFPFHSDWKTVAEQTVALRMLDLAESAGDRIDLLIAVRYPAYAIKHPNKVAWFIHHHREAYDLWDTEYCSMPKTPEGVHARDMMRTSDDQYLRECRRVFTNSKIVADRLKTFNRVTPNDVLYPPLPVDHPFVPGPFGDYIVYPSRLTGIKRQHLAIEAMRHVGGDFRLVILGRADAPQYTDHLRGMIRDYGLENKVQLVDWVDEAEKAKWIAESCGCLYLAFNEDSYGYVTLEAFHCHKPVITLSDSGGPLEVIKHMYNGLVAAPNAESLAEAMDRLWRDKTQSQRLGRNAHASIRDHRIHWDHVVRRLVA